MLCSIGINSVEYKMCHTMMVACDVIQCDSMNLSINKLYFLFILLHEGISMNVTKILL